MAHKSQLHEEDTTVEWDLETTEADLQLSSAIKELENVIAESEQVFGRPTLLRRKVDEWSKKLRNLRRHSRELFARQQSLGHNFIWQKPHCGFEQQVLRLAYSVEAATFSFLYRREMRERRQQQQGRRPFTGILLQLFNGISKHFIKEMEKAVDHFTSATIDDDSTSIGEIQRNLSAGTDTLQPQSYYVRCQEEESKPKVYNLWGYVSILGANADVTADVAQKIYEQAQKQIEFQIRARVNLSPKYDNHDVIKDIYSAIVQQQHSSLVSTHLGVKIDMVHSLTCEELFEKVKKWLQSCSFIIFLDHEFRDFLLKIKSNIETLFPIETGQISSTVIFRTCDVQASEFTRVIEVVEPAISFKDGWALFDKSLKKGGIQLDALINQTTEKDLLAKMIGKMCVDFPLAITMLPRLNFTNKLRYDESMSSTLPRSIIFDLLYQTLVPRIRLCYLYMGIFPKEFDIPVRRLFILWSVERLVIPDLDLSKTPEDLALSYLKELEKREMISIRMKNGRPKTCRVSSDMHRLVSRKAMDLGIFYVHNLKDNKPEFSVGWLAEHGDTIKNYNFSDDNYTQRLHAYISLTRKQNTPAWQVGVFLNKLVAKRRFGLLRVLDLENVYKPSLPAETIRKLFLLTYLGLRGTFLDSLPDSVGTLQYLEILDMKHTNITALPTTIWKAENLKHIYMNQVHFDMSIQEGFPLSTSLTNLQTLWGLSIGSNKDLVNWLSELLSLRKLSLTFLPERAKEIADSVSKLTNLQSLRLRSIDESGQPSKLRLPVMTELQELSQLYFVGDLSYLNETPHEFSFPPKLKVLTLTGSNLIGDYPIRALGKLPKLTILRFCGHSYCGCRIVIQQNEFQQLEEMKLWKLVELEKLEIQKGAMSHNLKELDIRSCPNMNYIKGLKHLAGDLQRITLTKMPADFVYEVKSELDKDNLSGKVQVDKLEDQQELENATN